MDIRLPDGTVITNVPEGTTQSQLMARLHRSRMPDALDNPNMAADVPWYENALAGAGKALVDTGRGVGQLVGAVSNQDVKDARERDRALMESRSGFWGNMAGNVAMTLAPGGAVKGAGMAASAIPKLAQYAPALSAAGSAMMAPRTISGAAGMGALLAQMQPSESLGERALNTGIGAVAAAAIPTVSRTLGTAKAALEPTYDEGQQKILARLDRKSVV